MALLPPALNDPIAPATGVAIPLVRWRPIETAPKDGSDMLLWCSNSEPRIVQGRWAEFGGEGWWGFSESLLSDIVGQIEDATHWMPLPSPPFDQPST